jgi:cytochrome c oxidase subunit I+III
MAQVGEASVSVAFDDSDRQALEQTWRSPTGLWGWLSNADHRAIGKRIIATAFLFFLLGGTLVLLMRVQLARPESRFLGPDFYNQIFTLHGTTIWLAWGRR